MRYSYFILPILCLCLSFQFLYGQERNEELNKIIENVQDHKSYDRSEFPLGLFTEDFYRREALFSKEQLIKLQNIDSSKISQTDKISLKLMKFNLQEDIDIYEYK